MKVKELIANLQRFDPDAEVILGAESVYQDEAASVFWDIKRKVVVVADWDGLIAGEQLREMPFHHV